MTARFLGTLVAAMLATGACAQTATSGATMNTQPGASTSSAATLPEPQATRSLPSRPSTPAGPALSGSGMTAPASAGPSVTSSYGSDPSIGGSGSAGLAAMGGTMDSGSATREMGAGAMTDCPLGTSRKMGLCVPYGQTRKKQP